MVSEVAPALEREQAAAGQGLRELYWVLHERGIWMAWFFGSGDAERHARVLITLPDLMEISPGVMVEVSQRSYELALPLSMVRAMSLDDLVDYILDCCP